MRTWAAAALAVVVALAVAGCATPGSSVSDPRLDGTWHLASASDHGLGIPIGGTTITLTIGDAKHTGGDSPCSSYVAQVTGGVGVVYIRAQLTGGTRDDCATPELNSVEKQYLTALTRSKFAAIDNGTLILSSAQTNLVFVRAAATPIATLVNSDWKLYAVPTEVPAVTSGPGIAPVHLRFNGGSGLTISSACVTITANYQIEGENFAVSGQHTSPDLGTGCTDTDRSLANEAALLLDGPLLIDVSSTGPGNPATLVVTNLDQNVPIVWRATS
ncbi:MAG TPA: META domain-containing protein [Galbitalea sp.]|jgi:heat shock protein HslJ|nr:META domain-containing protein [Galbitalea sp.]